MSLPDDPRQIINLSTEERLEILAELLIEIIMEEEANKNKDENEAKGGREDEGN